MARTLCKFLGVLLIIVGIAGFIEPRLLGMHLSTLHNIVHIGSGALALYFGLYGTTNALALFCGIFGAVYLLLGIAGFVAPNIVETVLHASEVGGTDTLAPDNVVHIVLGASFLAMALLARPIALHRTTSHVEIK